MSCVSSCKCPTCHKKQEEKASLLVQLFWFGILSGFLFLVDSEAMYAKHGFTYTFTQIFALIVWFVSLPSIVLQILNLCLRSFFEWCQKER